MGADLHLHTEAKIRGRWEHFSNPIVPRNHDLFRKMGMGGEGIAPIRGLPEDANPITRLAWEDFGTDSTTWYSHSEIGQLLRLHWPASPGREAEIMKHFGPAPLWCLGWDRPLAADVEDLRWVFWFA